MDVKHRIELVQLLKELGLPLVAAEVGCAEMLFSRDLISAGLDKLYLIDNWGEIIGQKGDGGFNQDWHDKNFKEGMERVAPYMSKIRVLKGMSTDMAKEIPDGELSLCYLDADHSYMAVMKDLFSFFPKVVHGGIIASHDALNEDYGVKKAFEDFCRGKYEIKIIPENSIYDASAYFIKK